MDKAQAAKWLVGLGVSATAALSGYNLIIPHEGSVKDKNGQHVAYLDAVGIPTACYGQTGRDHLGNTIKVGMKYSEKDCIIMLSTTLKKFEKEVDAIVTKPYQTPYQKAGLISFAYNVGTHNLYKSSLLAAFNRGDYNLACDKLSDWVYAKKKKLNGLVRRREEEKAWCMGQVPQDVKVEFDLLTEMARDTSEVR